MASINVKLFKQDQNHIFYVNLNWEKAIATKLKLIGLK